MSRTPIVLCVFGTRPEAIKMAPVIRALRQSGRLAVRICVSGQHREMLRPVLRLFDIEPDYDLDLMQAGQSLSQISCGVLRGVEGVLDHLLPSLVLVHGDTTTTMAGSLAAFYRKIPVGHVEAGLRTGDISSPWPEELNRRTVGLIATLHFAPTAGAESNLLNEGIRPDRVFVTGNTVVDALRETVGRIQCDASLSKQLDTEFRHLDPTRRLLLVTGHRRESFGEGFREICGGLAALSQRSDVEVVFPVHLNPNVRGPVHDLLGRRPNVHLMEPQDYLRFVYLLDRSYLVLTDSGGIQEEAPYLGKPVLVMRSMTERPEAVEAGAALLVGANAREISKRASRLLEDPDSYAVMSQAGNPYGDGRASVRIVSIIEEFLEATP